MSDLEKMELVQQRINELLNNFQASKTFPKSEIMKYYKGLEVTYDEFIEELEKQISNSLSEDQAKRASKILEEF